MLVNFNGNIINDNELGFDKLYRASMFGDGLFESIFCEGQNIYFLKEHLLRLQEGMKNLQLQFEGLISMNIWLENISALVKQNPKFKFSRIRILVWRKGKGTYNTSNEKNAHFLIFSEEAQDFTIKEIEKVGISDKVRIINSWYSDNKTINALNYVGASMEKSENALDDVFLINQSGNIIEASSSNIICLKNEYAFLPKKESGQVNGIMSNFLITFLKQKNLTVKEKDISESDIYNSDLIVLCNSFAINLLVKNRAYGIITEIKTVKGEFPKQLLLL